MKQYQSMKVAMVGKVTEVVMGGRKHSGGGGNKGGRGYSSRSRSHGKGKGKGPGFGFFN